MTTVDGGMWSLFLFLLVCLFVCLLLPREQEKMVCFFTLTIDDIFDDNISVSVGFGKEVHKHSHTHTHTERGNELLFRCWYV